MDRTLEEFEDILEPRRKEISHWFWALRHLNAISPCKHNERYTPQQIKVEVLKSPKISNLIDRVSQKDIPKDVTVRKVEEILEEIGYGRKLWIIRILGYVLTRITTKIYSGIFVNRESVRNLKLVMGDVPIMYVPSHRSYADFILMSYLLFYYEIEIPAIAAGMDFHGMKGMGTVLRNTGAFFMRRSYNSDSLYWDTFREYVHQLVTKGDKGIEFFVEGTRSRTGKTLYPKFGLLTMVLKAFFNSEVPDILFVPINLSYDRVMEERLFAFELLGVPKPKESTSGFFKSMSIVQEDFGNVYVNFGEPISAHAFFNNKIDRSVHSFNSVHAQSTTDLERYATRLFAQTIVESQQKLSVITTFNLIATILISWQKTIDVQTLLLQIKWLDGILRSMGALTDFDGTIRRLLDSINIHRNLIRTNANGEFYIAQDAIVLGNVDADKLKGHRLSEKTMTKAVPSVMLQIYVNPILFYIINPALVIVALRRSTSGIHTDKLFEEFNFLRSLFTREFVLFPENSTRDYKASIKLLKKLNAIEFKENTIKLIANEKLHGLFSDVLEPFFHTYYVLCYVLMNMKPEKSSEKDIIVETQYQIEKLLNNGENDFMQPYSLSLDIILNTLQNLVEMQIIQKIKRGNIMSYHINSDLINDIKTRICDYILHLPKGVVCRLTCKL